MAEGSGFRINPAMGIELRAGHVHRDRQGRNPAPSQSHRPAGRKRVQQATAKGTTRKVEAPELPRLRALEAQAASIPISSSAASSTSPQSGSSRVHPYPVGEAAEGSSFELVPSVATQAAQSWDQGEMEITPIRDANMSPVTPPKPIQKLSTEGGYRTIWGECELPQKVSRDMGYRSDSIAISRDMGPLSSGLAPLHLLMRIQPV